MECKRGTLLHFQEFEGRVPPGPGLRKLKLYELCTNKADVSMSIYKGIFFHFYVSVHMS